MKGDNAMIATMIHEGKTAEELGLSEAEYEARKVIVNEYPDKDNWDDLNYIVWLLGRGDISLSGGEYPDSIMLINKTKEVSADELSATKMAGGFVRSAAQIIKSGGRFVPDSEHKRRTDVCGACRYMNNVGRCMQCGCFVKIKSKFAAMSCPIKLW